jgi:phosphatidylglycerophosphatase A
MCWIRSPRTPSPAIGPAMANSKLADYKPPAQRTRSAWWLATVCGIGWLRPGPGTYASVAAVMIWFALAWWLAPQTGLLFLLTFALAILATAIGIPASDRVAREAGVADPGFVVIDEVAGAWIAVLAACLPLAGWPVSVSAALVSLLLFRVFDIWKPWPVSALDRMHGGAGIMLDDVAAGIYAFAGTLLLRASHLLR